VSVTPSSPRAGADVVVTVDRLHDGCDDHDGADEERPLIGVPVTFVQQAVRVPLGTVSGQGETFSARLTFRLPAEAVPGPALVNVGIGDGDGLTAQLTVAP
jgi:hypothetical protein